MKRTKIKTTNSILKQTENFLHVITYSSLITFLFLAKKHGDLDKDMVMVKVFNATFNESFNATFNATFNEKLSIF